MQYRRDIDGLRGIAVLLVVIFHAFPRLLPNGFLGVDIFFVISGYLITSIIIDEIVKNKFSIFNFISRRIKRILPASLVVLACSTIVANLTLFDGEYEFYLRSLKAVAGYFINYQLAQDAGYFDTASNYKPLMHFWSLAVEEQFYVVWPLFLLVVYKSISKFKKISIFQGLTAINLILLFYSLSIYFNLEAASYYLMTARAWQLLLGANIAFFYLLRPTDKNQVYWFQKYSSLAVVLGLLLISLSQVMAIKESAAILASFGVTLLILINQENKTKKIYELGVLPQIGKISYSLYLWHWPILAFLRIYYFPFLSDLALVGALLLATAMSVLTYKFIEKPLKKQNWKILNLRSTVRPAFFVAVYLSIFLLAENMPRLSSDINLSGKVKFNVKTSADIKEECFLNKNSKNLAWCQANAPEIETKKVGLIIGDSHAHSQFLGIVEKIKNVKWYLVAHHSCDPYSIFSEKMTECQGELASALNLAEINAEVRYIIFVSANRIYKLNAEKINEQNNINKLIKKINILIKKDKKVFFLQPVPEISDSVNNCSRKRPPVIQQFIDNSRFCEISNAEWLKESQNFREMILKINNILKEIIVIDPQDIICSNAKCSILKNDTLLYVDRDHLSVYGSSLVADKIQKYMQ